MNTSTISGDPAEWLMRTVKKNPEGLLLLAAGCALLLRSGGSSRASNHQRYASRADATKSYGSPGRDWDMPEQASRAVDTAREYASSARQAVSDTAGRYASTASQYADSAGRAIKNQSAQVAEQAQDAIERVVREQPVAVAIAGFAFGAAVAAAFPSTRIERETLGETGKRISDAASDAGERLTEAASAAGDRLMAVAEEKGLNTEGLKNVARDVAGTFGNSFSGDKGSDESPSTNKQSPKPGSSGYQSSAGASTRTPSPSGGTSQTSSLGQSAGARSEPQSSPGAGSRSEPKSPGRQTRE